MCNVPLSCTDCFSLDCFDFTTSLHLKVLLPVSIAGKSLVANHASVFQVLVDNPQSTVFRRCVKR